MRELTVFVFDCNMFVISQLIKWEANYHYHLYMYFVHPVHLMRFFPKHTTSVHIFLICTITDLWQLTDVTVCLTLLLSKYV